MILPIYLDYMATSPVDPGVTEKMLTYLSNTTGFGNSSSQHVYGYQAKKAIEEACLHTANLINCEPNSITWTSGATESNNLAIRGAACFYKRQGNHIITSKTEHKSVLETCKYLETLGFNITYLTPRTDGIISIDTIKQAIRPDTILISIMHVNNEIGVIQDIKSIGELARNHGILFHVDAAQSIGKISLDLKQLKIDLLSLSAHKIYGPKGVGALYIRQQPKIHLDTNGLRIGTLPTHQIVGMGEAMRLATQKMHNESNRLKYLRDKLWNGIKNIPAIQLNGSLTNRIANNLNISFPSLAHNKNDILISALTDIAISKASTCLQTQPSYVLEALGLSRNIITNTVRISIGRFTTEEEIDYTINHINNTIKQLI